MSFNKFVKPEFQEIRLRLDAETNMQLDKIESENTSEQPEQK